MTQSTARFLMLWFVVALQAMAPFIHAHAGAVQLSHAGFLHLHQGVHGDATWHAAAADEHGVAVDVAQGMPLRTNNTATAAHAPTAPGFALPLVDVAARPGVGLPAPPLLHLVQSDHILPLALAPPSA